LGLVRGQVEGTRISGAQGGSQARQGAVEQRLIGNGPGVVSELLAGAESGPHMDGLVAVRAPGDPDGPVRFDEHTAMLGHLRDTCDGPRDGQAATIMTDNGMYPL
jgi:hypothetical protein